MTPFDHIDFKHLIAKETNGRMRVRLMALSHIKEGANNAQAARNLHISRRSVNDRVKRFYENGLDGLKEKPRSGRPCALNGSQLAQLGEYVRNNSIKENGGRLSDLKLKLLLLILPKSLRWSTRFLMCTDCFIS